MGFAIASYFTKNGEPLASQKASWLGALGFLPLLAIPFMVADGQAIGFKLGHPGMHALAVCLSVGIVLIFGIPKTLSNSRISGIFETLGEYSYSIYLVHFPIIVFFMYEPFSGTLLKQNDFSQTVYIVLLVVMASLVMHNWIEEPFRKKTGAFNLRLTALFVFFVILSSVMSPYIEKLLYSKEEMIIFNASRDKSKFRCAPIGKIQYRSGISCEITTNVRNPSKRVLLVGDSHADSIKTTFAEIAEQKNVSVRFMASNDVLAKGGPDAQAVVDDAERYQVSTIILHYYPNNLEQSTINQVIALAGLKAISVKFIMPVPIWKDSIPKLMWRNKKFREALPVQVASQYENVNGALGEFVSRIAADNFAHYSVVDYFCKGEGNCMFSDSDGAPLYYDTDHLTLTGSRVLRELFSQIVQDSL